MWQTFQSGNGMSRRLLNFSSTTCSLFTWNFKTTFSSPTGPGANLDKVPFSRVQFKRPALGTLGLCKLPQCHHHATSPSLPHTSPRQVGVTRRWLITQALLLCDCWLGRYNSHCKSGAPTVLSISAVSGALPVYHMSHLEDERVRQWSGNEATRVFFVRMLDVWYLI